MSLTRMLNEVIAPTKSAIDSIRIENLLFVGALSKVLVMLEDNFKSYQTMLMSAENRIAFATKEFNAACKKANREDLIY